MANFTDTRLQPFTPYVEQLPIEAMVNTGRMKQAQYDQGIEKIQSQIDNIAGMDVVRDVDKQYLQSKLNQLGGNLKKVAAGDFSNYQLVNSVGGMITQIGKDPLIQNAVSSTLKYRKGIAEMEAARKEGKSSVSNEWDFGDQASKWLNSPDIRQSFQGAYNPYTNYRKNALEAIKSLTKDESITDDAFTIDRKGNLVITDATVRKKFAGISPDKIQKALMATLSPSDFKQMEIDGRYNYSNVDEKRLAQSVNSSYADKLSFYNQQKTILENAKSSTTSNVEKTALNDKIASLDKVIANISTEYEGMTQLINSGNTDALKAQLHTSNFIDNFSKAFSYTETSQTYETSPLAQMAMQRATKEQDWKKFLLGMEWDKEKFALTYAQEQRKIAQKDKELGGFGGLPVGIPQDQLPTFTLQKVIADTEQMATDVARADENFIRQQSKDREWLDAQKVAWEKNPTAVDPKVADHFNTSEEMRRKVDANKTMVADINKQAVQQFGTMRDLIPKGNPVTYTSPEGVTYTYTPEDFVSFNENRNKYIIGGGSFGIGGAGRVRYDLEAARRELSPKEFHLLQIQSSTIPATKSTQTLLQLAQEYNKAVNIPYKKTVSDINKFTADEVTKRITVSQGVEQGIFTGNDESRRAIGNVISRFADLAESQKGGLPNSPDFDVELARKLVVDPKSVYSLTVVEGTEVQPRMYNVNVTGEDGVTSFRVTPEQKDAVFGDLFEASPEVQAFRPYQEQIRKMGGYSTALAPGTSNHSSAYLGKIDFPSVQIYGVKANIEQPSPGKYSIRISAFDPVKKQWFEDISYPRNQLVREDQVIPLMRMLNDAAVYELLNETSPTAEDLKRVQQASKKPL